MATQKGIVSLPSSGGEAGLNRYLAEIKKFPILSPEEEYMLAKRWREHGDTEAAAKLVNSHLRLVAKIAMGYRGYGRPVSELLSEGHIGLLQGDEGGESQWQDFLVDSEPLQDERIAEDEESRVRHDLLVTALDSLNDREKHILMERRLADEPKTLEELSQVYGVSRERIRQ